MQESIINATNLTTKPLVNLLDFNLATLSNWLTEKGEKPFRAKQLLQWIHQRGITDFNQMTDLAKTLRNNLIDKTQIYFPNPEQCTTAKDATRKYIFAVDSSNLIETIYIPDDDRATLCVSSQAGCSLDCRFCRTGKSGYNRNLSVGEIIGQLWYTEHSLQAEGISPSGQSRAISNVVMMGMGEPLANYTNVVDAMLLMLDDYAYGLSRRRVTLSTAGIVPKIKELSRDCPVALAVSLHAANDQLRDHLVPINKKYPLKQLLSACYDYLDYSPRDFITFEYIMLNGINDGQQDAQQLLKLTADLPCKFNLIPFNPFPNSEYNRSSAEKVRVFAEILLNAGKITTTRRTRGDDINAACGQLAGQILDKTKRTRQQISENEELIFNSDFTGISNDFHTLN